MESIFSYTNYREFLKTYYEEKKSAKKIFSYQFLADHCGFKSKSYLYKVIRGDKALTIEGAVKIGTFMKLKKQEQEYFNSIVMFTNAKTTDERVFYFEKLQKFSRNNKSSQLRENQFAYFTHWYHAVIRELVSIKNWNGDYEALAKHVVPPISEREAKKSVDLLLRIGMIQEIGDGSYTWMNPAVTTGSEITSLAVNTFQRQNLVLATEAIDRFPREERDISTLTVSVSKHGSEQIQKEIAALRKKLINIVDRDKDVDRIYQINFQAFPLSNPIQGDS